MMDHEQDLGTETEPKAAASTVVRHPASASGSKGETGNPAPVQMSSHLLTLWFGVMAVGGIGFGTLAHQRPFGNGLLGNPLVVFFAFVAAGLLTVNMVHPQPITKLISLPSLIAGFVIAVACYFLGAWFGAALSASP
jgi:energy-converting hydrogenase Eha subunit C